MVENFSETFFLVAQQMVVSGKRIINKCKGKGCIIIIINQEDDIIIHYSHKQIYALQKLQLSDYVRMNITYYEVVHPILISI